MLGARAKSSLDSLKACEACLQTIELSLMLSFYHLLNMYLFFRNRLPFRSVNRMFSVGFDRSTGCYLPFKGQQDAFGEQKHSRPRMVESSYLV